MTNEWSGVGEGELIVNKMEQGYPTYTREQIAELNQNPDSRAAREEMLRNVAKLEKVMDEVVGSDIGKEDVTAVISNVVMEVVDVDPKLAEMLANHLDEVTETVQMYIEHSDENFLEPEKAKLLVEVVAPLHDIFKLLGGKNAQIMADHEQIAGYLLRKYLPKMGYDKAEDQELIDFVCGVVSDHEDIFKEEGRRNFMRSPIPEERAKAIFFLADTLTGVVKIDSEKLVVDDVQLEKRFGDLYFRHMDPEVGKVFRPEWGLAAILDYAEYLRVYGERMNITGHEGVLSKIVNSAKRAIDKAVLHDEWRKVQDGRVFDHDQNEKLRDAGIQISRLTERYPLVEEGEVSPTIKEVARDGEAGEVMELIKTEADQVEYGIYLIGGAGSFDFSDLFRATPVLTEGLVQWVNGKTAAIVGGGTRSGMPGLAGETSKEFRNAGRRLALNIGFAPKDSVRYQGWNGGEEKEFGAVYDLAPGLTHFVAVVPGESKFGDEAELMQKSFNKIVEGEGKKSVAILANGGRFSANELRLNLESGRRVVVLAGTGRLADAVGAYLGEFVGQVEPEMVNTVRDIMDIHPEYRELIRVVDLSGETEIEKAKKKFVKALDGSV